MLLGFADQPRFERIFFDVRPNPVELARGSYQVTLSTRSPPVLCKVLQAWTSVSGGLWERRPKVIGSRPALLT
jgi:hypothetical protein